MEKKSLLQLLAERSAGDSVNLRARNYAAFLAVKDDVVEAFSQGWSLMRIYQVLRDDGRIAFGYDALRRYMRRSLWEKPEKEQVSPKPPPAEGEKAAPGRVMAEWPKPGAGASPNAVPNSYKGEMPVFGRKSKPEDFGKF